MRALSLVTAVFMALLPAVLCTLGATPAAAQVYGNPLPYLQTGELAGGLQYSNFNRKLKASFRGVSATDNAALTRTTVQVGYGLRDDLGLDGYLGTLNVGPSDKDLDAISGTEFGVGVRKSMGKLGESFDAAVVASFRAGSLSSNDSNGSFTQLDVSYGVTTNVDDDIYAYAGAVLSKIDATVSIDGASGDAKLEGDSIAGVYGGGEYAPAGKRFRIGLELHLVHESGFGFYGLLIF